MVNVVGRVGFVIAILLAMVGLSIAVTRLNVTLQSISNPAYTAPQDLEPPGANFTPRYNAHPYWTLAHVAAGILFMTLGPVQFVAAVRNRWLTFHRWSGRVFLVAALVGVVTALVFVPVLPVFGSLSTQVGVVFASSIFLVCLAQGYRTARRRDFVAHREWMIRTFAIGLGISTFRVLIPFLMMPPIRASFPEAWDTVVWLGFSINAVAAEVWINLTRKRGQTASRATASTHKSAEHHPAATVPS